MNELALFAGAGGGILGGALLGWTTVGAVEIEQYPREVLLARQRDGQLPPFPVWDDVCTFDGRPWRGLVDVVSGGFPCQDISAAGKGAGIEGARSGLWKEMFRVICEVRPRFSFMENSPMLTSRGLGTVLGDLAEAGYNAAWLVLGAADVGAPHRRDRIWILAEDTQRRDVFSHPQLLRAGWREQLDEKMATNFTAKQGWWSVEPGLGRVVDGVANRVDRLKAIGNGQVPLVAATAFSQLLRILQKS